MKNTLLYTPHNKDCTCADCWETRYKKAKKLFEMACEELIKSDDLCPDVDVCKVGEGCKACWQRYFEEKVEEGK
jgi:hypothetical protein